MMAACSATGMKSKTDTVILAHSRTFWFRDAAVEARLGNSEGNRFLSTCMSKRFDRRTNREHLKSYIARRGKRRSGGSPRRAAHELACGVGAGGEDAFR